MRLGMYPMRGPTLNGVGIEQRTATPCAPWQLLRGVQRRWAGESTGGVGGCTEGLVSFDSCVRHFSRQ